MAQLSDRTRGVALDVTGEHQTQAAGALARLAARYAEEPSGLPVDELGFTVRVGAEAYDVTGRRLAGSHKIVAALVREHAPDMQGTTCGTFAASLLEAARALGWSDDANEPAIPRLPVPGPRESQESGRVPAPRREQKAEVAR